MAKTRIIFARILLVAYLAFLAYLCFGRLDGLPTVTEQLMGFPIDKVIHFLMFLPFPVIVALSFESIGRKWWQRVMSIIGIFLCGCMLAGATEVIQSFTTYRTADILDFRADVISLAVSSLIILLTDITVTCLRK